MNEPQHASGAIRPSVPGTSVRGGASRGESADALAASVTRATSERARDACLCERLCTDAARPSRFACTLEFSTLKSTRLLRPLAARRRASD